MMMNPMLLEKSCLREKDKSSRKRGLVKVAGTDRLLPSVVRDITHQLSITLPRNKEALTQGKGF